MYEVDFLSLKNVPLIQETAEFKTDETNNFFKKNFTSKSFC